MLRRILFIFLLVLPAQLSWSQRTLGFAIEGGKKKVQIPFELHNNLIVVPLLLNGMLPLKFIVDTGVQTAILTDKAFTDILDLPYSRKYTIAGPGGQKIVNAYVTHNVALHLPGLKGEGHAMLVLEQDYLELRNHLGTDVHGVLGYELFSRFIIKVDYAKKMLTVYSPSKFKARKKFERIPISLEDTKPFIEVPITLADSTVMIAKLLVDSGASHGLLLEPTSSPLIKVPDQAVSSIIGRGIGGEIMGKVGRVTSISLGSRKLSGVIVNFPDPDSYMDSLKLGTSHRNGTIGGEVLSRFTVIFNFSKEEIFLKKNSSFNDAFYYNLSGITIRAKGSQLNVFEITEVRDHSAAQKADILPGDLIQSVNGIRAEEIDLNTLLGHFNQKPGKKISLSIKRNGVVLKRQFHLESQI